MMLVFPQQLVHAIALNEDTNDTVKCPVLLPSTNPLHQQ